MEAVYLDNSATTRVSRAAADKAYQLMTETFGNPSSLHTMGFQADRELAAARESVAKLVGAPAECLYFTSGGTEANNLAVFGSVAAHPRDGHHIVTTAVEHSSVRAACDELEKQGYAVTRLMPDGEGNITARQIIEACRPDTVLVAVMLVNNETGARIPLEEAVGGIRRVSPKAHIHADAVQAAGKLALNFRRCGLDSASISAHKLHGPKGSGALYVRSGVRLKPRNVGGKQENGLRCGTEAAPLIAAFGVAAGQVPPWSKQQAHYDALRQQLLQGLEALGCVQLHLPVGGVPYIVHFSVPGLRSETMLHFLAQRDIYVSSGSACSKGAKSPVLEAMGLPTNEIDSALRVSFSMDNTPKDIERLLQALQEACASIARR